MFKLEFQYEGKKYKSFDDVLNQTVMDGIKETVENALKPFEAEINKHGGSIVVNIPQRMDSFEITFEGIPEELVKKIEDSFEEE